MKINYSPDQQETIINFIKLTKPFHYLFDGEDSTIAMNSFFESLCIYVSMYFQPFDVLLPTFKNPKDCVYQNKMIIFQPEQINRLIQDLEGRQLHIEIRNRLYKIHKLLKQEIEDSKIPKGVRLPH